MMNRSNKRGLSNSPAYLIGIFLILQIFSVPIYAKITILADTTWYSGQVIDTGGLVEIDHGATLTIEGGVAISNYTSFLVLGDLIMEGTDINPIEIFEGRFCFFTNHETPGYIEFNYVIMDGGSFSESGGCSGYGYFKLQNSKFYGVDGFYLWYPVAPSEIVKNIFIDSDGLQGILSGDNTLNVLNNVFVNQLGSAVSALANYGNGFFVKYNSFLSIDKTALEIQAGYESASMIADNNYFGTTDTDNIEDRILDRNDSLMRNSVIEYMPYLDSPHPDTPIYESYTLNITKSGIGIGTIISDPTGIHCGYVCAYTFELDTDVTLTATPDTNNTFTGWSGDADCDDGILTMDSNKQCTATFNAIRQLTVNKTGNGQGTVTSNPTGINCGSSCSAWFNLNGTVTLTATPATGSSFTGWSGGGCTGTGTCTLTIDSSKNVSANFTLIATYPVTATAGTGGTISPTSRTVPHGESTTFTVTPDTGYQIGSVSGCNGTLSGTTYTTGPIFSACTVSASFTTLPQYLLSVTKTGKGKITSAPTGINCGTKCKYSYMSGTSVTLTADASSGYQFIGWSGACTNTSGTCTIPMTSDTTVTATFKPVYKLTVTKSGAEKGSVTSAPAGIECDTSCAKTTASFVKDTPVVLTATPILGKSFKYWLGACSGTDTTCTVPMNSAKKVKAVFK